MRSVDKLYGVHKHLTSILPIYFVLFILLVKVKGQNKWAKFM